VAEEEAENVEGEEGGEEGGKKKSKKKLIVMVVLMLAIGYEAASMTILKPPPLTAAQKKAKADKAKFELETKCAIANSMKPPEPPPATDKNGKKSAKKTETTEPPEPEVGLPVLVLDSVTINLNGEGNHYLKLGLGLQMPKGTVLEEVKLENPGTPALNYVISELRKRTLDELAKGDLEPLQHELGYKVCSDPALNFDGEITSVYFTDFVTQ
jgi:flagellar basal body-associated protein FliL